MKRFSVNLTDEEYKQLKKVAIIHNKPMSKVLRIYLRVGLATESIDADLIIRKCGKNTRIIIVEGDK